MKTTLAALVENKPGVLNRVVSLFRRRNFNLDSLTVGRTHHDNVSRMTIVVDTHETADARKIISNLYKLVDVIEVQYLPAEESVTRDMALVKINATTAATRNDLTEITYQYGARIVDIGPEVIIVEITGREDRVETVIDALEPFGIVEVVRSGAVSMGRGTRTLSKVNYESKRSSRALSMDSINSNGNSS
jgi:acetolactate synthase-1/3 small subunit